MFDRPLQNMKPHVEQVCVVIDIKLSYINISIYPCDWKTKMTLKLQMLNTLLLSNIKQICHNSWPHCFPVSPFVLHKLRALTYVHTCAVNRHAATQSERKMLMQSITAGINPKQETKSLSRGTSTSTAQHRQPTRQNKKKESRHGLFLQVGFVIRSWPLLRLHICFKKTTTFFQLHKKSSGWHGLMLNTRIQTVLGRCWTTFCGLFEADLRVFFVMDKRRWHAHELFLSWCD